MSPNEKSKLKIQKLNFGMHTEIQVAKAKRAIGAHQANSLFSCSSFWPLEAACRLFDRLSRPVDAIWRLSPRKYKHTWSWPAVSGWPLDTQLIQQTHSRGENQIKAAYARRNLVKVSTPCPWSQHVAYCRLHNVFLEWVGQVIYWR